MHICGTCMSYSSGSITTKFCTCIDSGGVVTYAKFCCDSVDGGITNGQPQGLRSLVPFVFQNAQIRQSFLFKLCHSQQTGRRAVVQYNGVWHGIYYSTEVTQVENTDYFDLTKHTVITHPHQQDAGLILGLRPANERRRYSVTTFLIGWAQA